jgi:MoaA/NifB/PqqE/SkfB family radical SAM enzyme
MYDMLKRLKYFRRMIISRYLLPGGYSLAPTQVAFLPTARCNLRCDMCAQWGSAGNLLAKRGSDLACDEMAFDKWQDIVDEIAFAKPLITIWGGEPLLYHDILRLISHVKARSLHCLVITNGILLEQYAADLVKSGLDKIEVSIDGPREINDGIRLSKG